MSTFVDSLTERGLSDNTVDAYRADIEAFEAWRRGSEHESIGEAMRAWLHDSRSVVASSTLRRRRAASRTYLRWVGEPTDALDTYRLPPLPPARPHPLPGGVESLHEMLRVAEGATRRAIALGGLAGLRVSETLSVTSDNLHGHKLAVLGKGEKERDVPVSTRLMTILDGVDGRYVPDTDRNLRRRIKQVAVQCGLPDTVSSHDLRATFATTVYDKTKDVPLVSRLLGHASITTTQVYLGLSDSAAAAGVEF